MPQTDYHGSSSPSLSSFGRSFLNLHRDQVHSMEPGLNIELDAFQRSVSERFHGLSGGGTDELLSISWIRSLLDAFICCQEEFKVIMLNNEAYSKRPPMDRLGSEYFERNVKALDVCNAVRDGIEQVKDWQKQLEIVLCALNDKRTIGEGQFRRSKKALIDLTIGMIDEKEPNAALAHRNRSFGRNNAQKERNCKSLAHFRSLSWSVSRSWSASKQIQSIGNNLTAPKSNEVVATNGLALAVYTMSSVLFFVMWVLVAAIPCQDRGLQTHFGIPKQFLWAAPILSLHERILEESKRKDRRNSCGLLKEIHEIEKFSRKMNELSDSIQFPLNEEKEREVRKRVEELAEVYEDLKNGLDPLERQVREVFHRIVRSRTDGLDSFGR